MYKNYKGHNKNVDFLFETNIISFYYSDLKMPIYYKTYELLKNELDIYEKNTLQYAYLSITNYCNANCVFCDVHENL